MNVARKSVGVRRSSLPAFPRPSDRQMGCPLLDRIGARNLLLTVVVVDRGLRNGLLSHSLPSTIVLGLASASVTSMISNKVKSASSLTGSGGPVTLQPFSLAYPAHLTARQRRGIYEAQIRAFVEASDSVDLEDDVLADILDGFEDFDVGEDVSVDDDGGPDAFSCSGDGPRPGSSEVSLMPCVSYHATALDAH